MNIKADSKGQKFLTIGKVSRLARVNRETVRYYEREGILLPPARNDSGYRIYSSEIVKKIRFIKHAQELGFSLKEITELMALQDDTQNAKCLDVKQYAINKVEMIKNKLEGLKRMRNRLLELIHSCDEEKSLDTCPILDAFEEEPNYED